MNLMRGDKGPKIVELQNRLMALGYDLPAYGADGDFGDETMTAVENFQRDNNILMDGVVGDTVWNKMFSTSATGSSNRIEDSVSYVTPITPVSSLNKGIVARVMANKMALYGIVGIGAFVLFKQLKKRKVI